MHCSCLLSVAIVWSLLSQRLDFQSLVRSALLSTVEEHTSVFCALTFGAVFLGVYALLPESRQTPMANLNITWKTETFRLTLRPHAELLHLGPVLLCLLTLQCEKHCTEGHLHSIHPRTVFLSCLLCSSQPEFACGTLTLFIPDFDCLAFCFVLPCIYLLVYSST